MKLRNNAYSEPASHSTRHSTSPLAEYHTVRAHRGWSHRGAVMRLNLDVGTSERKRNVSITLTRDEMFEMLNRTMSLDAIQAKIAGIKADHRDEDKIDNNKFLISEHIQKLRDAESWEFYRERYEAMNKTDEFGQTEMML